MSRATQVAVELHLAETGTELRAAIEAAQYAHLVSCDELDSPAEQDAARGFVEAFSGWVEAWDERSEAAQRQALAGLTPLLEALEARGLFVHWGIVRRRLSTAEQAAVTLPVAVLTIGRYALPVRAVMMPSELGVTGEVSPPRH